MSMCKFDNFKDSSLDDFKKSEKQLIWICPEMNYNGFLVDEEADCDDDEWYFWFNAYLRKHVKMHPVFKLPVI